MNTVQTNIIHEDREADFQYPTLKELETDIMIQADDIGKHIEMWNKDDIPEAISQTDGSRDDYYYDEDVPVVVKLVAYAMGINYLNMQEDIDGNKWPFSGYHNIVFDEQGRQIGHMIYPIKNSSIGQVILYTNPIIPQVEMYEDN